MSYADWKDKTTGFKKIDVRGIQGNFFQGIKKHAINTEISNGLEIVQSFDPIPLYDVMEGLGLSITPNRSAKMSFTPTSTALKAKKTAATFRCAPRLLPICR